MADQSSEKPIIRRDLTGGTYCFSDLSSSGRRHGTLQTSILQGFESTSSEIYNFNSRSMEMTMMMVGFQSPKDHFQGSYSKGNYNDDQFYQQQQGLSNGYDQSRSLMVSDDPSLRCVFPCEANERPGQGLSLSLSSSNPSSIGLQSFELRRHDDLDLMRFGSSSSSPRLSASDVPHLQQSFEFQIIRNSKYLGPAKEFLNELCSLGDEQTARKMKAGEIIEYWEGEKSVKNQEQLYSLDPMELQRRKTKLLRMLEEVDRRYKHYRNHMEVMVSSFEAVAGDGSSAVYSSLASKAMSRHFRCLRDGIVSQLKATKTAMGDNKGIATLGNLRSGETSRWRLCMMETHYHPWRRRRGLPEKQVSILRAWLFEHFLHPYPSDADKHMLALKTGLTRSQVSNWYINARVRLWKPMVEEMYLDELKEQEANRGNNVALPSSDPNNLEHHVQNQSSRNGGYDQKPAHNYFSPYSGGTNAGVSLTLGLHDHQDVITSGGGHESLLPLLSSSSQSSIFYNPRSGLYEDHGGQNLAYSSLVGDCGDQGQSLPLGQGFDWNTVASRRPA